MEPTTRLTCRAVVSGDDRACIERSTTAFALAVDHVTAAGLEAGTPGNRRLHHLCYRAIREQYELGANLAIRAIARAAARLKGEETEPTRVDYDGRICSISADATSISLATICGRIQVTLNVESRERDILIAARLVRATVRLESEGSIAMDLVVSPKKSVAAGSPLIEAKPA